MRHKSPIWKFANLLLEGRLDAIVAELRADGNGWRRISRQLWLDTSGEVDITHETLRRWYQEQAA